MPRSALVIDPVFLKHDPGEHHPESPDRIKVLLDLAARVRDDFDLLPPEPARQTDIERCHDTEYIEQVRATSQYDRFALDGDTMLCRDSFAVALMAVGGFLKLLDGIASGDYRNGFTMVRPPGHHALRARGMGFCLFNTIAIGAEYLKHVQGAERIAIVDWDVHHGNGTQEAFYDDPSVLFISTHQYPFYPGTGAAAEVGTGAGEGRTVNIPLPAGCGDAEYLAAFQSIVVPVIERFEPTWLLVSAGFDAHRNDPLAGMQVTASGFTEMAGALMRLAHRHAGGKIAFLLEGGYDLNALQSSVANVLGRMLATTHDESHLDVRQSRIATRIREVLQIQERYW